MLKPDDIKRMLTWDKDYSYQYEVYIQEIDIYDEDLDSAKLDPKVKDALENFDIVPLKGFDFTEEGEKELLKYAEKCLNLNLYMSITIERIYDGILGSVDDKPLMSSFKIYPEMLSYNYDHSNIVSDTAKKEYTDTCQWTLLKYDWFNQLPKPRINAAYDIKNKLDDILLKKHGLKITEDYKNDSVFS